MNRYLKSFYVSLFIITIIIGFLPIGEFNFIVQLIFVLIGVISVYGVLFSSNNGNAYSLNTTYWLFNYTFFFIAPITQFKYKTVFYTGNPINDSLYINAGLVILGASFIYLISYNFFFKKIKEKKIKEISIPKFNFLVLIILSGLSSLIFLLLIKFNFQVILYRPPSGWLKQNTLFGNLGYAVVSIIRYVPFFCLLLYLLSSDKKNKGILILLFLTLFTTFPLSLSRGILAGIYLPLIVLFFPILKKKQYFLGLFFLLIVFAFPLMNSFRDMSNGFRLSYELFNSSQLDAYQNFMLLLNEKIVTNGSQLIDALFFLNENRKGSGQILGEQVGYNFYNVAMPFLGEGFINFGYIGVVIFITFITYLNAYLDKRNYSLPMFIRAIYLVLIGFEFYILRGDLSSSIKKMSGFILALLIVTSSLYIYNKIIKVKNS